MTYVRFRKAQRILQGKDSGTLRNVCAEKLSRSITSTGSINSGFLTITSHTSSNVPDIESTKTIIFSITTISLLGLAIALQRLCCFTFFFACMVVYISHLRMGGNPSRSRMSNTLPFCPSYTNTGYTPHFRYDPRNKSRQETWMAWSTATGRQYMNSQPLILPALGSHPLASRPSLSQQPQLGT
jgi:hypothetical protein